MNHDLYSYENRYYLLQNIGGEYDQHSPFLCELRIHSSPKEKR